MNELQPGIEAEMAGKLSEGDASMRLAAAGVLAAYMDIAGLTLETAMDVLFRAFPGDAHAILRAVRAVEALQAKKLRGEQNVKAHCRSIVKNGRGDRQLVATAQAVLQAIEDRSGLLRAGTPERSGQDELLRPAHDAGYTDPNELVRAAGNEQGAEVGPLEQSKGGVGNRKSPPRLWRRFWKRLK